MVDHARPGQVVTLEAVQEQFRTWRNTPHRDRRIPEELWHAAVRLCAEHSLGKVASALRLDYRTLKFRCQGAGCRAPRPFVELGPLWTQPGVFVECEDGNRHQMRIHCQGPVDARVVDLVKGFFGSRR
jgi:hypothetical protein